MGDLARPHTARRRRTEAPRAAASLFRPGAPLSPVDSVGAAHADAAVGYRGRVCLRLADGRRDALVSLCLSVSVSVFVSAL